jgi:hypothetical protein
MCPSPPIASPTCFDTGQHDELAGPCSGQVLIPEPRRRVDLLNDVDPRPGWIVHGKAALTPQLVVQPICDCHPAVLQAPVLGRGVLDCSVSNSPFPLKVSRPGGRDG